MNLTSGQASVGSNELIRIQIPNGLIDLSTFRLSANVQDNGNPPGVEVPPMHLFIDRFSANLGGISVGNMTSDYGVIAESIRRATIGLDVASSHELNNFNAKIPASATATIKGTGRKEFSYYPYSVCQINGNGILDTTEIGVSEIEIQLGNLTKRLLSHSTLTPSASVTLTNLKAYVDVIDLADGERYAAEQKNLLRSGQVMKMVLPNIVSSVQPNNGSMNFNVSTQCIDMLFALGQKTAKTKGNDYYTFVDTNTSDNNQKFFFQIGSTSVPSYGYVDDVFDGLSLTTKSWGKHSRGNYNLLCSNLSSGEVLQENYKTQNHVVFLDLSLNGPAHSNRMMTGPSSEGGNSIIRFETNNYDNSTVQSFVLGALTSSIFMVRGEGSVGYEL
jgi:hypothetical protein